MAPKKGRTAEPSRVATPADKARHLYQQYRKTRDARMVVELEALSQSEPSSAAYLALAKCKLQEMLELVKMRTQAPKQNLVERIKSQETESAEREALEAEVLELMHQALEAACEGGTKRPLSVQCFFLASHLLFAVRGRGSVEQIEARKPWRKRLMVTRMLLQRSVAESASGGKKGGGGSSSGSGGSGPTLEWVPIETEGTIMLRWPFEFTYGGPPTKLEEYKLTVLEQTENTLLFSQKWDERAVVDGDGSQQDIDEQLKRLGLSEDMGKEVNTHLLTPVQDRLVDCKFLPEAYVNDLKGIRMRKRVGNLDEYVTLQSGKTLIIQMANPDSGGSSSDEEEDEASKADAARRKRVQHGKLRQKWQQTQAANEESTAALEARQLEAARAVLPRVMAAAGEGREEQLAALLASLSASEEEYKSAITRGAAKRTPELKAMLAELEEVLSSDAPLHPGYEWQDVGPDGEVRRVRNELPEVLRKLEDAVLDRSVLEMEVKQRMGQIYGLKAVCKEAGCGVDEVQQAYRGAVADCVLYEREEMPTVLDPSTAGAPISPADLALLEVLQEGSASTDSSSSGGGDGSGGSDSSSEGDPCHKLLATLAEQLGPLPAMCLDSHGGSPGSAASPGSPASAALLRSQQMPSAPAAHSLCPLAERVMRYMIGPENIIGQLISDEQEEGWAPDQMLAAYLSGRTLLLLLDEYLEAMGTEGQWEPSKQAVKLGPLAAMLKSSEVLKDPELCPLFAVRVWEAGKLEMCRLAQRCDKERAAQMAALQRQAPQLQQKEQQPAAAAVSSGSEAAAEAACNGAASASKAGEAVVGVPCADSATETPTWEVLAPNEEECSEGRAEAPAGAWPIFESMLRSLTALSMAMQKQEQRAPEDAEAWVQHERQLLLRQVLHALKHLSRQKRLLQSPMDAISAFLDQEARRTGCDGALSLLAVHRLHVFACFMAHFTWTNLNDMDDQLTAVLIDRRHLQVGPPPERRLALAPDALMRLLHDSGAGMEKLSTWSADELADWIAQYFCTSKYEPPAAAAAEALAEATAAAGGGDKPATPAVPATPAATVSGSGSAAAGGEGKRGGKKCRGGKSSAGEATAAGAAEQLGQVSAASEEKEEEGEDETQVADAIITISWLAALLIAILRRLQRCRQVMGDWLTQEGSQLKSSLLEFNPEAIDPAALDTTGSSAARATTEAALCWELWALLLSCLQLGLAQQQQQEQELRLEAAAAAATAAAAGAITAAAAAAAAGAAVAAPGADGGSGGGGGGAAAQEKGGGGGSGELCLRVGAGREGSGLGKGQREGEPSEAWVTRCKSSVLGHMDGMEEYSQLLQPKEQGDVEFVAPPPLARHSLKDAQFLLARLAAAPDAEQRRVVFAELGAPALGCVEALLAAAERWQGSLDRALAELRLHLEFAYNLLQQGISTYVVKCCRRNPHWDVASNLSRSVLPMLWAKQIEDEREEEARVLCERLLLEEAKSAQERKAAQERKEAQQRQAEAARKKGRKAAKKAAGAGKAGAKADWRDQLEDDDGASQEEEEEEEEEEEREAKEGQRQRQRAGEGGRWGDTSDPEEPPVGHRRSMGAMESEGELGEWQPAGRAATKDRRPPSQQHPSYAGSKPYRDQHWQQQQQHWQQRQQAQRRPYSAPHRHSSAGPRENGWGMEPAQRSRDSLDAGSWRSGGSSAVAAGAAAAGPWQQQQWQHQQQQQYSPAGLAAQPPDDSGGWSFDSDEVPAPPAPPPPRPGPSSRPGSALSSSASVSSRGTSPLEQQQLQWSPPQQQRPPPALYQQHFPAQQAQQAQQPVVVQFRDDKTGAAAGPVAPPHMPPTAPLPGAGKSWAQAAGAGAGVGGESGGGEDEELAMLLELMGVGSPEPPEAWGVAAQQEQDDMQAALQASLADQEWAATHGPPDSQVPDLATPGLANEAGEYNCFLNVIIQCLWHCAEFRRQVTSWPPELYCADPVVHALRDLFLAFAEKESERRAAAGGSVAQQAQRSVANPTPLREALSALPGQLFSVGEMHDASEVLLAIYDQISAVCGAQGRPLVVEPLFGLRVTEYVHCGACGLETQRSTYVQHFFNTQATALRLVAIQEGRSSLGRLLRLIEQQAQKTCDTDVGGCGVWNPVTHILDGAPRVFTLQLAWESQREEAGDIAATLAAVDERVDLGEIYRAVEPGQLLYRLRSLVCYYGAHYQAFVLVPDLGRWLMFDDTRVSNIGTWADVRRKCELGRIQPSVLFYEAE